MIHSRQNSGYSYLRLYRGFPSHSKNGGELVCSRQASYLYGKDHGPERHLVMRPKIGALGIVNACILKDIFYDAANLYVISIGR